MNMNTRIKRGGIAAVAFVAAAIAGGLASAQDKPTIYVIAPSLSDPFWITQQNGANQAAKDFGVNVVFQAPPQDTGDAGMVPLLQAAIAAKPAGIAIDYTSKTMEPVTKAALDAGINVVLYNNNRFEGDNAPSDERLRSLAFIGQNEAMSGETLTKAWLPMLPKEPCKVLIVNPFPTAFVLTLRGDGVKRALDAAGYPHSDLMATGDQGQNSQPDQCGAAGRSQDLRDGRAGRPGRKPGWSVHFAEQAEHPGRHLRRRSRDRQAPEGRFGLDRHQPAAVPAELLRRREPGAEGALYLDAGQRRHRHLTGHQGQYRYRASLHRRRPLLRTSGICPADPGSAGSVRAKTRPKDPWQPKTPR